MVQSRRKLSVLSLGKMTGNFVFESDSFNVFVGRASVGEEDVEMKQGEQADSILKPSTLEDPLIQIT